MSETTPLLVDTDELRKEISSLLSQFNSVIQTAELPSEELIAIRNWLSCLNQGSLEPLEYKKALRFMTLGWYVSSFLNKP